MYRVGPTRPARPSRINISRQTRSTNRELNQENWQELYGLEWEALREQCLHRDNYTCQDCGAYHPPPMQWRLEAHHIIPLSKYGENTLKNLITHCKSCHARDHGCTPRQS